MKNEGYLNIKGNLNMIHINFIYIKFKYKYLKVLIHIY